MTADKSQNLDQSERKPFRVEYEPLVGFNEDNGKVTAIVYAKNDDEAKDLFWKALVEKNPQAALYENPLIMIASKEINFLPANVTDVIENMDFYLSRMKDDSDHTLTLIMLKNYVNDYFKNVELDDVAIKMLGIFAVDKTYRIVSSLEQVSKNARIYLATIISEIFNSLKSRNSKIFFIVDNTFNDNDKFENVVELFRLAGFCVLTPYNKKGGESNQDVQEALNLYLTDQKMIMYIEKEDPAPSYLEQVKELAQNSTYLTLFRSKGAANPHIEVLPSKIDA